MPDVTKRAGAPVALALFGPVPNADGSGCAGASQIPFDPMAQKNMASLLGAQEARRPPLRRAQTPKRTYRRGSTEIVRDLKRVLNNKREHVIINGYRYLALPGSYSESYVSPL